MTYCYRLSILFVSLVGIVLFGGFEARAEAPPPADVPSTARPMVDGFPLRASNHTSSEGDAQAGANGAQPTPTPPAAAREGSAQLGDKVTVRIVWDPDTYKAGDPPKKSPLSWFTDEDIHKVVPYLDGSPLKGVYPEAIDSNAQTLQFHLVWTPDSKDTWKSILGNPTIKPKAVTLSVGVEGKSQIKSLIDRFNITILPPTYAAISLIFVLLAFAVFLYLAVKTAILKDPPPEPAQPGADASYSLARVQMAIWLFVVIVSFLLIWVTTGNFDTITGSTVVLMGISATTAVGAVVIAPGGSPSTGEKGPRRFLLDILTDNGRISFHRFQILVLTLMFVFVFLKSVVIDLQMPQFDTGVLALMGISAGTYLGFKLQN